MRFFRLCLVVVVLFLHACAPTPSIPKGFPKEKEMAVLLADLYFAEATLNSYPNGYREQIDKKSTGYYREVLQRHGLNKEQYDTIMAWYSSEPYLLSKVYDRVISILGEREVRLKNELKQADSLSKRAMQEKMLLTKNRSIWRDTTAFVLPVADSLPACLPFSFALDSIQGGVLKLEGDYRFERGTTALTVEMMLAVAYADSSADTIRYALDRSFQMKNNQVSLSLKPRQKAVRTYGFLADYDTLKEVKLSVEKVNMIHLPKLMLD